MIISTNSDAKKIRQKKVKSGIILMITCVTKRRKDFSKKIIEIVNNNLKDKLQVHCYKLKKYSFKVKKSGYIKFVLNN